MSTSELNIYQRMREVMRAVSYVQKEDKKVNNQYTFVSHDAVTAKIRPALIEAGIITVPRVVRHAQDGNRTEADIEVDFVNVDKPDEKVTVSMFGFGIDPQDKGPGKAISYAVKYALLKAFSLETGDDPEKDQIAHEPKTIQSVHKPTDGAWDGLPPDLQIVVLDLSNRVRTLAGRGDLEGACDEVDETLAEYASKNDMRVALWDKLADVSSVRNQMKKVWESRKDKVAA